MGESEKIVFVRTLVGDIPEATPELISAMLLSARSAIYQRLYPFGNKAEDCYEITIPHKYDVLECRLAARYCSRLGGDGEVAHSENGINRTYGSVNDEDLLSEVMQVIGVGK